MKQNHTEKYNLTEGSILNKLLLISLPIMGTQFLQMAYNLTDMFWLGRLSSDAVAASGTAGMYTWLSMAFLMFGRMGAEIGISQNIGKGNKKEARLFSYNSTFLAIVLGVAFGSVLLLFRGPLIGFFRLPEESVVRGAQNYLAIVSLGIPATFISAAINGSFTGAGNSKTPFVINAIGLVINMVLDPVFIFVFNMGIEGAAIATITAQILICIIFLAAIKISKVKPFPEYQYGEIFHPGKQHIRQIFNWSTPIAMESMLFTCLSLIISRFVAVYGAAAIAVQKVGSQVESLSWLIGGGFSSALTAFIGQNYGSGKWTRIRRGVRVASVLMGIWGIMITTILFFGGRFLVSLFLSEPELLVMGENYLKILAACQFVACMEALAAGAFRGVGKTLPPSVISISCNIVRIPIVYLLSNTSLGIDGIWWGITIGGILRGLLMFGWYIFDAKKQPRMDYVDPKSI